MTHLLGLGTALPQATATQAEALALALRIGAYTEEQRRALPALYRRAGVQRRHVALDGPLRLPLRAQSEGPPGTAERMAHYVDKAPPLAARAARAALDDAGLLPDAITHLITVSCTGASAPGLDIELLRRLELPAGTERAHVGFMGCHGALAALRLARAIAAGAPDARILLAAVELCSLHFHYGFEPDQCVANALFADGAAAAVLGTLPDRAVDARDARDRAAAPRLADAATVLLPDSEDAMTWTIGDRGFRMTLSPRVPQLIGEHLRPWLDGWLDARGRSRARVRSWAVHPGGPRVLSAVEQSLALPPGATDPSRALLASHGNMSSPTILFLLERLRAAAAPRPWLALAFGPGLVVEAALWD
jgi:predicted naringenin-chalcone synthase